MTAPRIAIVGVGATGARIAHDIHVQGVGELVGAFDTDPAKVGRDLGELAGIGPLGITIVDSVSALSGGAAQLAVLSTTSSLAAIADAVAELAGFGMNVLSLCEQLSYPWQTEPKIAARLDDVARRHGVSILGTGCNPGFVMDTLPIVLSAAVRGVQSIELLRTADVRHFGPHVVKLGLGLTAEQLDDRRGRDVRGHFGFEESLSQLADAVGWSPVRIQVEWPRAAVVAAEVRRGDHHSIAPGTVAVAVQHAQAVWDGHVVISATEYLGFVEPQDAIPHGDTCRIVGSEQTIDVRVPGGFDSAATTAAVLVNMIEPLLQAEPGLRSMGDFSIRAIAAKAGRHPASAEVR